MKNIKFYTRKRNVFSVSFSLFIGGLMLLVGSNQLSAQCTLACNDLVYVSLDENCTAVITPQTILEGDESECINQQLTVDITDAAGFSYGNMLDETNVNQELTVSITDGSGNSCWGTIIVQDKSAPALVCDTVYTTCTGDLLPGSEVSGSVSYAANVTLPAIPDDQTYDETFEIEVLGLDDATITDINFYISIDHLQVSDLAIELYHPDGTMVSLLDNISSTCNNGIRITIDDDAMSTYADLQADCVVGAAKTGSYIGAEALTPLEAMDVNGIWQVRVLDNSAIGGTPTGGTIKKLALVVEQEGAFVSFPGPNVDYNTALQTGEYQFQLDGLDPCGPALATFSDSIVNPGCDTPFDKLIYRTWNAVDEQGNRSVPCTQLIYVYRNDLSTLVLPPDYDGSPDGLPPLSCTIYGDQVPTPEETGFPDGDLCDNIQIFPPEDTRIDICQGSYKLIREWRILEWCSGELVEHRQIIKVVDEEGPQLTCQDDMTISTEAFECYGSYTFPLPGVVDNCSDEFTYELSYQYADLYGNVDIDGVFHTEEVDTTGGQYTIQYLPLGKTLVRWRVTDDCDQTSECTFEVWVEDLVPPVAVCDEFTVVSIGSDGLAKVAALTFDDGSHDNCEIMSYEARKMTDACNIPNNIFRDTITFCCAEVNTTIMVELKVTDISGNSNTCMVEITINDKLPPYIINCPADDTLGCWEDYTDLELTGNVIPGIDAIDNCGPPTVDYVDDVTIDQCGRGTVKRTWTAVDGQGLKHSCEQFIYLIDDDPFDEDDIHWPYDLDTAMCEAQLDVEDLDDRYVTRVDDDKCSLTAVTYEDKAFYVVQDACEKIIRTWSVIDWCTYDARADIPTGFYTHKQVLKLQNFIAPVISNCTDQTFLALSQDCTAEVDYVLEAFDDCTPEDELVYSYQIDLDFDGDFDMTGHSNTIDLELGLGEYDVRWKVEDKCGNVSVCDQVLIVIDGKNPTPYCITSVTTAVMNNNGMVAIWARDFDFGSFDNCTHQDDLWFTFNQAKPVLSLINQEHFFKGTSQLATEVEYQEGEAQKWIPEDNTSGMIFDCDNLPDGKEELISLDMTVWDEAMNRDYCTVELVLQDNNADYCLDIDEEGRAYVSGRVATEYSEPLENVVVSLIPQNSENIHTLTTQGSGTYTFTNIEKGQSYEISGEKNSDLLNGVSTLDIVMIQRHILGLQEMDSHYKVIAADIDNNDRVSATDILALRKAILGLTETFPNSQTSWKFINKDQDMGILSDPFPYEEGIMLHSLNTNMSGQDLVAIKVGDVNNTARANARQQVTSRSEEKIMLAIPHLDAERSTEIEIPFYLTSELSMIGMQFTLDYDPGILRYNGYLSESITLDDSNLGVAYEEDGIITFSWNDVENKSFNTEEPLFVLRFEVLEDTNNDHLMSINSALTAAEVYTSDNQIVGVELSQRMEAGSFALQQNVPNPFSDITRVEFMLPEASYISLEIADLSGKVLKTYNGTYNAGQNVIVVNNDEISVSGVLYYTLRAGKYIATKKMVSIR